MTADGWIPTGGRRPEGLADDVQVNFTDYPNQEHGKYPALSVENVIWSMWKFYRLAQPAAQEHREIRTRYQIAGLPVTARQWFPTSTLPDEGRVVELRPVKYTSGRADGRINHLGLWELRHKMQPWERLNTPSSWEWRYPAAGPSDAATINAAPQEPLAKSARAEPSSTVGDKPGEKEVSPVGAAPYRSRNGYGLRIREADKREREPLLISYDVFRRMK